MASQVAGFFQCQVRCPCGAAVRDSFSASGAVETLAGCPPLRSSFSIVEREGGASLVCTPRFASIGRTRVFRTWVASPAQRVERRRGAAGMAQAVIDGGQIETAAASNGAPVWSSERRVAHVERETKETKVEVEINLDGMGKADNKSGIHFLDHMLDQIASHGLFDVRVRAKGDTWIDDHHTNEDLALAFGKALADALGDRKGIYRFGNFSAPLDEALVHVVLDLSGRPHLSFDLTLPTERIGTYETQLVEHFFQSVVNTSGMTLHIRQLAGKNSHHIVEATFKAFARALRQATEQDPRRAGIVPSSKGVLTQQ